ncbi:hypothetical protein AND_006858 [Anopheles darlingi]|uniref:Ig-like domain-containing protein n=1 Tax=Anopheles darlingi TaxID=43151 RepID=W5JBW2_ANODA|nr:hypothetical protein AND_006858 [Anopheles darlingi]
MEPDHLLNHSSQAVPTGVPCYSRLRIPTPKITWTSNGKPLPSTMIDYAHESTLSSRLVVRNLSRAHQHSVYSCQASNFYRKNVTANVTIELRLRPLAVELVNGTGPLSADRRYIVQCQSVGSRPPAKLTWWMGGVQLTTTNQTSSRLRYAFREREPPAMRELTSNRWTSEDGNSTLSSLSFTPTREDHGKTLICRATNELVKRGTKETSMKLNVFCDLKGVKSRVIDGKWRTPERRTKVGQIMVPHGGELLRSHSQRPQINEFHVPKMIPTPLYTISGSFNNGVSCYGSGTTNQLLGALEGVVKHLDRISTIKLKNENAERNEQHNRDQGGGAPNTECNLSRHRRPRRRTAKEKHYKHDAGDLPTLKLELGTNMNPEDIEEGDDVYFECKVNANPPSLECFGNNHLHRSGCRCRVSWALLAHIAYYISYRPVIGVDEDDDDEGEQSSTTVHPEPEPRDRQIEGDTKQQLSIFLAESESVEVEGPSPPVGCWRRERNNRETIHFRLRCLH